MTFGSLARWRSSLLLAPMVAVVVFAAGIGSPQPAQALDSEEMAVLQLINDYRAANGLGTLTINNNLNTAARWMSEDMAANNYFSHTDSLGRDPFVRIGAFGYTYNTWKGENLAAGVSSAAEALELWKGSPGHNANMLSPNYTVIGIARAYGASSTFGWYWTTDFGGQADAPAPPPAPTAPPAPPPPPAPVVTPPPTPNVTAAPAPVTPPPTEVPTAPPTPAPTPEPSTRVGESDVLLGLTDLAWWEYAVRTPWIGGRVTAEAESPALIAMSNFAREYLEVRGSSRDLARDPSWKPYFGALLLSVR